MNTRMKKNAALITLFSEFTDESEKEYRYVFYVVPLPQSGFKKEGDSYIFEWAGRIGYGPNPYAPTSHESEPDCSMLLHPAAIGHGCWRPENCNGHWQTIAWQEDVSQACVRLLDSWKDHVATLVARFNHDARINILGDVYIAAEPQ